MRPWNSGLRWKYSPPRLAQQGRQTRQMRITKSINPKMDSQGLSLVQAKRKIRRCTQLYYKIRYWASTTPFCSMKFTIVMRYVRKTISTHSKCNGRTNMTLKSCTKLHLKCRRKVHSSTREVLIHRLSIQSILSWSSIVRALILHGPSTSLAVAIVLWCLQIRPLRNVDYSQMQLTTLLFLHLTHSRTHLSSNRHLGWTITNPLVYPHRDFVGCQIFCKVQVHHK